MEAAELLYNKGFISYPRTETNSFKPSTNFYKLVELQKENHLLGEYASFLLKNKIYPPRAGNKNDNSHPPIYPARFLPSFEESDQNFTKEEILLYELIARSFLASCSKDATAIETKYDVEIEGESFFFKELLIKDLNYLTIYPYDKWHETVKLKEKFVIDQILNNVKVTKKEGKTYPPKLLNESQLIDLMDINGIGTDSTIHEHIKKIQEREYAIKLDKLFYPTALGYALIETYEQLGLKIIKPDLRSKMEKEMMLIVEGSEEKDKILKRNLIEYQEIYKKLEERKGEFEEIFFRLFNENREKFNNNTKEKSFRKKKSI